MRRTASYLRPGAIVALGRVVVKRRPRAGAAVPDRHEMLGRPAPTAAFVERTRADICPDGTRSARPNRPDVAPPADHLGPRPRTSTRQPVPRHPHPPYPVLARGDCSA